MEKPMRALTSLCVLALAALIGTAPAAAQEHGRGTPDGGVKVHGHWTVDIRNADGSLASHTEFENALQPTGSQLLVALLTKDLNISRWTMSIYGTGNGGPCKDEADNPVGCVIYPDNGLGVPPGFENRYFPTLGLNAPKTADGSAYLGTLEVTGNFTASVADPISSVGSFVEGSSVAFGGVDYGFSGRYLDTPIQVAVGQKIYIKIVYSFS